uniref:Uncharacterized protein AlNc14C101G6055 n=1 Tax=Albugo laibachii Nc14 TaxID=890382 RepID=F0WHJ2_9STRA|nr:conserved hypothetical protein [Albugo laibachii Nc14]|eukprot:CCA20711.1 conserved hypothetical protein [Albugo laibachii Nc14]
MQSPSLPICHFNDCDNVVVEGTSKCSFHRNRRQCAIKSCTNQVYARRLCVRHGGKKQCQFQGCDAHARGGGYCIQHGGFVMKRFCVVEGCKKQAHARQKCVRHGGGRQCRIHGCLQHARAGGLCNRHSHGHECSVANCDKTAQHMSTICFRHAMELRSQGENVAQLNVAKGSRSSNKRQHLQPEPCSNHTPRFTSLLKSPFLPSPIAFKNNGLFPSNTLELPTTSSNMFPISQPAFSYSNTSTKSSNTSTHEPSFLGLFNSFQFDHSSSPSQTIKDEHHDRFIPKSQQFPMRPFLHAVPESSSNEEEGYPSKEKFHSHSEYDDLESILHSYSKVISPASISPMAFSRETTNYIVPLPVDPSNNSKRPLDSLQYGCPPSLVRLNSLLPPPPGTVMGQIPLSASFSFNSNSNGSSNAENESMDEYLGNHYFHNASSLRAGSEIVAE